MNFPVRYPRSEPCNSRILAAFRALSLNAKAEVLFAADGLRQYGMETADLVAVVDDTFDVGIVHVAYTTALILSASVFLTVIRRIATGEHWITDIAVRRPSPQKAVQSATAALGLNPSVIDVLSTR